MSKKIFLIGILYSSQALSANCKPGPEAYGSSAGIKPIGGVLPSTCGGKPCEVEVGVNDMLAPGKDLIKIEESTRPDGTKETKYIFGTVDKEQEKESAKEASEKAQKEATEAKQEADRQEKEAAEAQEKAEKAEKEAADLESAEKAAEAEKQAEAERLEAEAAKEEAEAKAAEAEAAKKEAEKEAEKENPPPEDDEGGLDEDDNVRPVNDGADPWADEEAKNKKAKQDYAQGKGPLDCSNPKVQCVNAEIKLQGSEDSLKISVPITKGGVDCRYSRCLDEDENTNDSATDLLVVVDDICTYSECMSEDPSLTGSEEDCGTIGKRQDPIYVPKDLDKAILESIKSKGPRVVKVEKKPSIVKGGRKPTDFNFNFPKSYKNLN